VVAAVGAAGFACGSRNFHRVPRDEVVLADEMISEQLGYEVPGRWFSVGWTQATRDLRAGLMAPCPHTNCDALSGRVRDSRALNAHFVHTMVLETRKAGAGGPAHARSVLNVGPYRRWSAAA
jgi:hypothetical protein